VLREDNRAIIRAASQTSKAANYTLGFLPGSPAPKAAGAVVSFALPGSPSKVEQCASCVLDVKIERILSASSFVHGNLLRDANGRRTRRALLNKGSILGQLGRSNEATTAYDDLIHRFGIATHEALRSSQTHFSCGTALQVEIKYVRVAPATATNTAMDHFLRLRRPI